VPTLCVFVIRMGVPRWPDSSTQAVPVISPLPFSVAQPAKTRPSMLLPRGSTAVMPVRTGPLPITSFPLPETSVTWPTSTPVTSVMALCFPGVPSNGTPRSRARGFCAEAVVARVRARRRVGSLMALARR
jgi:hypothetical protein